MARRKGLRINASRVDKDIGDAFKLFAGWLRRRYEFPVRIPVYLSPKKEIKNRSGEICVSTFFAPFENEVEPYIRIATGDYIEMCQENGKTDALFSLLHSLALGVLNYRKWIEDNEHFDDYEAEEDAEILLKEYIGEVGNPLGL